MRVWRVSGCNLDGSRIRENHRDENRARCRQIELEADFLQHPRETAVRATKLSDDQLQLAELARLRLGDDWARILDAVDSWNRTKTQTTAERLRVHKAIDQYLAWLENGSSFRPATKQHWRRRLRMFRRSVENIWLSQVTPEVIEQFLDSRTCSAACKDTEPKRTSTEDRTHATIGWKIG
jgi:hypothetical protein